VLYDIPADVQELSAGIGHEDSLRNRSKQGKNDFGKIGYGGPAPPSGPAHHYHFKLYGERELITLSILIALGRRRLAGQGTWNVHAAAAGYVFW
jgi:hypothetical protein